MPTRVFPFASLLFCAPFKTCNGGKVIIYASKIDFSSSMCWRMKQWHFERGLLAKCCSESSSLVVVLLTLLINEILRTSSASLQSSFVRRKRFRSRSHLRHCDNLLCLHEGNRKASSTQRAHLITYHNIKYLSVGEENNKTFSSAARKRQERKCSKV